MKALLGFLVLAAQIAPSSTVPQPAPDLPRAQEPAYVLKGGTAVPMVTIGDLSSRTMFQGDRFDLKVEEAVLVSGLVVIPEGARAVGEIARVVERGYFGKPGKLEVRLLFVEVAGQKILLAGHAIEEGKNKLGAAAAVVVLAGGLGGFVAGKSAVIPAGTPLVGYVRSDLPLKVTTSSVR